MKLFAIKVGESIGSFAPSILLPNTLKEIKTIQQLEPKTNKEEHEELLQELEKAEIVIGEIKIEKVIKLSEYTGEQHD